ncbi:MAG TPA: protein kinase [Bryobacteraceae bacterium]|nr:protein kinase [Bryobacteraceae bacterium]
MPSKAQDDDLVMSLVDLALAVPGRERQKYVETACAGDTELLTQVMHYIEWEERMDGFLLEPLYPPPLNEHPFESGDLLLDRFRIVREVAQGGMGIVYEALDEKLQRRIALKCAKTGFRKRLPPEVRNATAISHPNVCKIFEIHSASTSQGDIDFLTMEFLEGETLSERLRREPLPPAEARAIAIQLCAGLAEAHRNHVVHGDLKSNNVILTTGPDGSVRAVITDFGLARKPETGQGTLPSGERGGTPDYMAPELWRGEPASPASDVYALGVILYELASGRRPFPSGLPLQDRLSATPAALHSKWDRTVGKCLAPDPSRRFQNGQEVAQALAPNNSRRWFVAAAAAVILAIITGAVTYQRAAGPKESWRFAVLPFQSGPELTAAASKLYRETDPVFRRISGGKTARLSIVPMSKIVGKHASTADQARSLFAATHVLRTTLEPQGGKMLLHATLTDTRSASIKDWQAEYTATELRYAPVALAGFVTETLRLPPVAPPETVNTAAKQDYLDGLNYIRRDSGVAAAIASFERAVAADPDSPLTYAGLAEAQWFKYYLFQDPTWLKRATESAREAELRDPDLPAVHRIQGILLQNSGLYELAEAEYRRSIELDPKDGDGYRRLGVICERISHLDEALASFRQAIELNPGYYRNYQALGTFYFDQSEFSSAVPQFQKAVELAPEEPTAHFALANAYETVGRFADAERELRTSLQLGESANSLIMLGVVLIDEEMPREAAQYISRALQRFPEQYLWWIDLGMAYELAELPDKAMQSFRSGLALAEKEMAKNPRNGQVRSRLGYLWAKLGHRTEAESEIAQALQLSPQDAATRDMAVRTYDALQDREKAVAILAASPDGTLVNVLHSPDLAGLRTDDRFQQLLTTRHLK